MAARRAIMCEPELRPRYRSFELLRSSFKAGLALLAISAASASARTWHVHADGGGDAPTIQAGIDSAVSGDDVLLAPGTYSWTSQAPSTRSMVWLKPGIRLHTSAGAAHTVLDAEWRGRVLYCHDVGGDVLIEGLTVLKGSATEIGMRGGGLLATGDSSPTIRDCVFDRCQAVGDEPVGGAISCDVATIAGTVFIDNYARGHAGAVRCGAARITRCVFRGNGAGSDGGSAGALGCDGAVVEHCLFENNAVYSAVPAPLGGAVAGIGTFESCVFVRNRADGFSEGGIGGAIALTAGLITQCIFVENSTLGPGTHNGGAIYADDGTVIERSTLLRNSAPGSTNSVGGIEIHDGRVENVIIASTLSGRACGGSNSIWSCSDLFGNAGGDQICGIDGGGNFSVDPLFCRANPGAENGVEIHANSPCAPNHHPTSATCGLIGAGGVGCGDVRIEVRTWGDMKARYR